MTRDNVSDILEGLHAINEAESNIKVLYDPELDQYLFNVYGIPYGYYDSEEIIKQLNYFGSIMGSVEDVRSIRKMAVIMGMTGVTIEVNTNMLVNNKINPGILKGKRLPVSALRYYAWKGKDTKRVPGTDIGRDR